MEKEALLQQVKIMLYDKIKEAEQNSDYDYYDSLEIVGLNSKESNALLRDPSLLSEDQLLKVLQAWSPQKKYVTVRTANFEAIQNICRETQIKSRMVTVLGEPGFGKSVAIEHYYRNSPNTIKVEATSSMRRGEFLAEILDRMGLNAQGSLFEMITAIAAALRQMHSPLLIIDEISKLHHNSLMDLHDLRNRTMDIAGVVLVGCGYFETNLLKERNRQKQGIPEFHSRMQAFFRLDKPTKMEYAEICKANGITNRETIIELQRKSENFRALNNAILNETDKDVTIQELINQQ